MSFAPSPSYQSNGRTIHAIRDARGRLIATHHRIDKPDGTKQLWWEKDGKKGLNGTPLSELPLYGTELVEKCAEDELIVVAEGEKACDALKAVGIAAVGTVTGASGTPGQEALEVLRGREVTLWPDNDDPGREHMRRVAERLCGVACEVRWYEWPEAPEKGDAADHPATQSGNEKRVDRLLNELMCAPRWEPKDDSFYSSVYKEGVADEEKEGKEAKSNGHIPGGVTAADLYAMEFPELRYCVKGLLPEGVWFLAGKPKLGKSWLALQLGISVASGSKALGGVYPTDPGDVLYLALEDGLRRLQQRLKKLLPAGGPPERLEFFTEWPKLDAGGAERLDSWLEAHPDARLVVIDTLKKVRPKQPGRSLYIEDYEAVEPLASIAQKHGVTILVVHHLRQSDADDPYDMISGSTGLTAAVDGALILKRERGRADAFLYADGRDLEETVEIALEWSKLAVTWTAKGPAEEYRLSQQRAAIIKVVSEFSEGTNPTTVYEALPEAGIKMTYDAVRRLMTKMVKDGQLSSPKRGVYLAITGHNGHEGHNADTYRTENVTAKEKGGHNNNNNNGPSLVVTPSHIGGHNQLPITEPNATDVNDVTTNNKKKQPLTEEQAIKAQKLISQGTEPSLARAMVLGEDDGLVDRGGA